MTAPATSPSAAPRAPRPGGGAPRRRGGVYVLVLGCATMIAVVGLGAIAVSRVDIQRVSAQRDWARAEVLAQAGIETALARMNTTTTWRTDYAAGAETTVLSSAGTASFKITDPGDGDLTNRKFDTALVTGYGRIGQATRIQSVQCAYTPPPVLSVLKYAMYAGTAVTTGDATIQGAPLGSPSLTNSRTLTADFKGGVVSNSGTIVGLVRTGDAAITTFSDGTLWSGLSSRATTINYASIGGGKIEKDVLSAANDSFGSLSAAGIYLIQVPATKTLVIHECRIVACLLIDLQPGAKLDVQDKVNWDRPSGQLPTLVVRTSVLNTVHIGTSGVLAEGSGSNYNPPGTPYNGVSNATTSDQYPGEVRGIVHVLGLTPSLKIDSGAVITGIAISEGSIDLSGSPVITYDGSILQDPPTAYTTGASGMAPITGSFKWEVLP